MNAIGIAGTIFLFVFGGALLGMFLGKYLPDHHRADTSRDAIKLAAGIVATLAALVLGLLVASAKESFSTKEQGIRTSAVKLVLLDRAMANYGPDTAEARAQLRGAVETVLATVKSESITPATISNSAQTGARLEEIERRLLALKPQTKPQEWLQSRALQLLGEVMQTRLIVIEQLSMAANPIFLMVLTLWLAFVFLSFGLLSPRHVTALTALLIGALSVSGAILIIVEMERAPLSTLITISSAPLHDALTLMGR